MKRQRLILAGVAALLIGPASAKPDWSKVRLHVLPGIGTKNFELGAPLPDKWPKELGEPDLIFPFHGTGEGTRRIIWGETAKGQLSKGVALVASGEGEDSSITDIEIRDVRAGVDEENLFLGVSTDSISKRSQLVQADGKKSYLLPGLSIESGGNKLIGFKVHSPAGTRWRFRRWRVRPGEAVGPIRLGEPLDEWLFSSIGDPHQKSREFLLWQADDSSQTLKISLEPRTGKVTRIHGKGLPWRTPNGISLGDTTSAFEAKHPESKSGLGRGLDETTYKLPGLRATFNRGRLISFDLYEIPR